MKLRNPLLAALLSTLAITLAAGCGGDDSTPPEDVQEPAANVEVTVDEFKSGFADETGFDLTADDFPGGAKLLSFDEDGEIMELSEAETEFQNEFGTAQIYVVEDGDPAFILNVAVGKTEKGDFADLGDDRVALDKTVASQPDENGVIWTRQCVRYEKAKDRNVCSWSGTKQYGKNVIVTWTSTDDSLDEAAARLDQSVSAAVAGS